MKSVLFFILRGFAALTTMTFSWLVLFFIVNLPFLQASLYSFLSGVVVFFLLRIIEKRRFLKKNGLSRQEFKYIQENLIEASRKMNRLQKALIKVRSIDSWKMLLDINRKSKRIYHIVKNEPKRFYQSERFFFYHLDTCVELAEKYTKLAAQPIKDVEIRRSLEETKGMLHELHENLEQDLILVLQQDIEHLQFEMDVAKKQIAYRKSER
ncbi:5-bromo-4-chloroindolyl phosphate hydrolysis family protein [Bacillus sp. FJAT-47783]|uniref:5-bromo-4-chloroindolyl phosphate hydrolysis family protein n=1 Tax=Bacillus sp. FJAT-47783 TaxID=2922712 RepID=UPI001FAC4BC7|nr:5-bromo-4-chloroindolyl phosphate hydrolysis family protein [Bacillus sp. FJAT-47783]